MSRQLLIEAKNKGVELYLKNGKLAFRAAAGALDNDLKARIAKNKEALIALLQTYENSTKKVAVPDIQVIDKENNKFPLSFSQQRLWLLDRIETASANYSICGALTLSGQLNEQALTQSISTVITRHESLRTVFLQDEKAEPYQKVQAITDFSLTITHLEDLPAGLQNEKLEGLLTTEINRPFDLTHDLMLRGHLIKLAAESHVLLLTMHHIASDGWSINVLIKEMSQLYSANCSHSECSLQPLKIQYADYAYWQRNFLNPTLGTQVDYWKKQLHQLPELHNLTLDYPRPNVQSYQGATLKKHLPLAQLTAFKQLCTQQGATLFMGLHTVFSILLGRYESFPYQTTDENDHDIVIGTPIANREQAEVADMIGFFVNTLVLRTRFSESSSFIELLQQCKKIALDAYAHQQVPFEQLVEVLQPDRSLSYSPLFQVMLVLQNNANQDLVLENLTLTPLPLKSDIAKYDLTLDIEETSNGLHLQWEYCTALFSEAHIERMSVHFNQLLEALMTMPECAIGQVDMLSPQENHQLQHLLNDTSANYPEQQSIHGLFEQQVQSTPDAIAVSFQDEALSYAELNCRANQLAHYLLEHKNIQPETLVGLCVERSINMIVGILGILKAGAAYVPIEAKNPKERLHYIVGDSNIALLLAQHSFIPLFPNTLDMVALDGKPTKDDFSQLFSQYSPLNPSTAIASNLSLAYIIYTSGSTGKPKGVMIEHRSLCNQISGLIQHYQLTKQDRILQFVSPSFDVAAEEIFGSLLSGAHLILCTNDWLTDAVTWCDLCQKNQVTLANLPTLFWSQIAQEPLAQIPHTLRQIIIGGDAVTAEALTAWWQRTGYRPALSNAYGPTETTINATINDCLPEHNTLSIGKPCANTQVYVCNAEQKLVPEGVVGELYIGGVGLARGYLNQTQLTSERFIDNPFYQQGGSHSKRLYKTGDLVRWLPEGDLAFLGRVDHQVKIRGFRIELGDVEAAILSMPSIAETVVMAIDEPKRLVSYLVTSDEHRVEGVEGNEKQENVIELLRQHLGEKLPEYMIPSAFMTVDNLPLMANGKIDRKALPTFGTCYNHEQYIPPSNDIERTLCDIWQATLNVEKVGIHDNFFHLGGHSLLATQMIATVNKLLSVVVPLKVLFSSQTVAQFAQAVSTLETSSSLQPIVAVSRNQPLPLSFAQQRLWMLDRIDKGNHHYLVSGLLRLTGQLNYSALTNSLTEIIQRHESLRTTFNVDESGIPHQHIQAAAQFNIPLNDLSTLNHVQQQEHIELLVTADACLDFDLTSDLMLRSQLIKLSAEEHLILLTTHHIASDGWSVNILVNELSTLYSSYCQRSSDTKTIANEASSSIPVLTPIAAPVLAPLALQYADYAYWQRTVLKDVLNNQLTYWQQKLFGIPELHSLPTDYARPALQSHDGALIESYINAETLSSLKGLCKQQDATLFMGLYAVFSVLLARYSGQNDIVIGTPIANREQVEVADMIGFFINTLVLRTELPINVTFNQLLEQCKETALDAYAHQQVPFEQLVEVLQPDRSLSYSPLFQVMLALQNNEEDAIELEGLTIQPETLARTVAKYDLTLNVEETPTGLTLQWEYSTTLFKSETVQYIAEHFNQLLTSILVKPDAAVMNVEMLSSVEREQLLNTFNQTESDYPASSCIHQLFEQQVVKTPNALAVIFENSELTYTELNARANQVAHYLIKTCDIKPDSLVGLCVERSLDMIVGMLGILKAGGVYVPLDPNYPTNRLAYMLNDAALSVIVTQTHLQAKLSECTAKNHTTYATYAANVICLDDVEVQTALLNCSSDNTKIEGLTASHLAYAIYTSGSTGEPKASLLEHQGLCNLVTAQSASFEITADSRVLQFASFSFDAATSEWGMALTQGATLCLIAQPLMADIPALECEVKRLAISHVTLPPALLPNLQLDYWLSVTHLVVAGDMCSQAIAAKWSKGRAFYNAYGPSETTVCSNVARIKDTNQPLNIGSFINNVQGYVFDEHQNLCAIGTHWWCWTSTRLLKSR